MFCVIAHQTQTALAPLDDLANAVLDAFLRHLSGNGDEAATNVEQHSAFLRLLFGDVLINQVRCDAHVFSRTDPSNRFQSRGRLRPSVNAQP